MLFPTLPNWPAMKSKAVKISGNRYTTSSNGENQSHIPILPDFQNAAGGQSALKENHLLTRRRACATPILPDSDFQDLGADAPRAPLRSLRPFPGKKAPAAS